MPPLKELPFGAYVAWCPSSNRRTALAVGRSGYPGTVDIVDIDLGDTSRRAFKTATSVVLPDGVAMSGLSWTAPGAHGEAPYGLLAVGTDDGVVRVWNPDVCLRDVSRSGSVERSAPPASNGLPEPMPENRVLVAACSSASDPVTCVEFNSVTSPSLIACGHGDGTLNIINLDTLATPELCEVGPDSLKAHGNKPVTAVAWNQGVPHILASTCLNGTTAIWNLKQRKGSIRFRDPAGRQRTSSVAWVPNQATQVIVAYDDDTNPSLQMWDLRNTSYPFKEFPGHSRGIVNIRMSTIDPSLFLTCGRDNRTVCWALNASSDPTIYSEVTTTEWQRSARWSPCLPGLFASTSNIDGVTIDSVQERRNPSTQYVPRWFQKPAGASFGFGGKLAVFNPVLGTGVRVDIIPTTETELVAQADEKILESEDDYERLTWQVVQTLFYPTRSGVLLDRLGFKVQTIEQAVESFLGRKPGLLFSNHLTEPQVSSTAFDRPDTRPVYDPAATLSQGPVDAESFFNDLGSRGETNSGSAVWDGNPSVAAPPPDKQKSENADACVVHSGVEGGSLPAAGETCDWSSHPNTLIKTSFLVGQRSLATEVCIESGRWADALLLAATSGDATLWEKTKEQYVQRRSQDKFLQMIACVIGQRWADLVHIADLTKWEETLALLASYVPREMFSPLTEELGRRLETEMFDIRAAVVCYLTAGSFRQAAHVWSSLAVSNSRGKSLQKVLQDLVEKLTILKKATNFQEDDPLFNQKVSQYAEILANSGRLVAGMKFLCLVGQDANAHGQSATSILRHRIFNSSPEAMRRAGIPPPTGLPFSTLDVRPVQQQQETPPVGGRPAPPATESGYSYASSQYPQPFPTRPGSQTVYPGQQPLQGHPSHPSLPGTWDSMSGRGPHKPDEASAQRGLYNSTASAPPQPLGAPLFSTPSFQPPGHSLSTTSSLGPYASLTPSMSVPPPPPPPPPVSANRCTPPVPHATALGPPPHSSTASLHGSTIPGTPLPHPPSSQGPTGQPVPGAFIKGPAIPGPPKGQPMPASTVIAPPMPGIYMSGPPTPASGMSGFHGLPNNLNPTTPNVGMGPPMPGTQIVGPGKSGTQTSGPFGSSMPPVPLPQPGPPLPGTHTPGPTPPTLTALPPRPAVASAPHMGGYPPATSMNGTSGHDVMAAAPGMIPKSTAPTAAVSRMPPGMPVPWPIPTGTQQVGSSTQSTAPANQKIHAILDTTKSEGIPMGPSDLSFVQRVLFNHLDLQIQHDPHNTKKHEDLRVKLGELVTQLQEGTLSKSTQSEIMQFCKGMDRQLLPRNTAAVLEMGDYTGANQIQAQLTRTSWSKDSRNWLTALKRLLAK